MISGKNLCITLQGLLVGNNYKNDPLLGFLIGMSLLKVSESKEEVRSADVPVSAHHLQQHSLSGDAASELYLPCNSRVPCDLCQNDR